MQPLSTDAGNNAAGPLPQLPDWVAWLQAGLTALLAVLFLVMLGKARVQAERIEELQERVQGLENSRALERTTGLEQHHGADWILANHRGNQLLDLFVLPNPAPLEFGQLNRALLQLLK